MREPELRNDGVLGSCGFFLLPDNGDWARGVTDHGLRYVSHQRRPYPSLPPAAHHYRPGTHALGQVDAQRQITQRYAHGYSGLRPARFEVHLRVLFCRAIEACCWLALQVTVEERQRVGVDDAVRPLCADRPGEAQSRGERRQQWDVSQVEVEHPGHLHEVTISRQALEHRPHGGLVCVDLCLWPTACFASFEAHGFGIPGDPHAWLLQALLDHVGRHGGIHYQAGPQAALKPAGFADDEATQRDPEGAATLQVQPPSQDAVWVGLVQGGKLIQCEAGVLREIRDDAILECPAVQYWRSFDRAVALPDQGLQLVARQPSRPAPIREDHIPGGIRLIDGRDDVAVGDQLLDLEGVHLAKAP